MPPVSTARKRTARQLSQDPTHLLEFMLGRNMGKSSTTRPADRDFALEVSSDRGARIGDSEDDVPTVPTLSEMITLRSHELLDLVGQRHQAEAQRIRKGGHVDGAGFDHCWTAFVNAASERDQAEKRLEGIEQNKSARENAIKSEKRRQCARNTEMRFLPLTQSSRRLKPVF
ncbi:hypothetical protein FNYG_10192 [Fusarium nygamai]|uniref:Uncharacterized protein n=1 Tax=Gibberella nygamai TaxID=42673 RepID=A0A2K0W2H4_GIBNY|nr:hypothetical protein FNYG_10192 [Fusarium nygamai]